MYVFMSLLSYPVSLSRSLLDARTPNPTDRPRVISLSPLTHIQIFICAQPSQCTAWHQQSCATRTRPCGDLRDLEKMSQIFPHWLLLSSVAHSMYHPVLHPLTKTQKHITLYLQQDSFWNGTLIEKQVLHRLSDHLPIA